ncbi:MAG: TonB-dependent receptor, partial [Pseudomonadota bacterium]
MTARHREESAQTTPISLVSLGGEQIDQLGINNIGDLQAVVPNLNLDPFPANNQTLRLFIRGIGLSDVQITQDPAVGVYLNGVYIARSTGLAFDLPDLERIEVLRGAQGTLYGRNTTGGAINLITRKPDLETLSLRQDVSAGNLGLKRTRTSLNLPLGQYVAAKLAYLDDRRDGFIDNDGPGGNFGDRNSSGARVDLRVLPGDNVTLDYAWDRSRIEYFNYTPQAHYPAPLRGGLIDLIGLSASRFVPYSEQRLDALSTSVPLLPTDIDVEGHTLSVEYLPGDFTLRSLTAWRQLDELSYIDFASGASGEYRVDFNAATLSAEAPEPLQLPAVRPLISHEQWSQELQWLGPIGERMDFLAGLYYFEERASEFNAPEHHLFSAPLGQTRYPAVVNIRQELNDIDNSAAAAYGQLNWTPDVLRQRLNLGLGLRYSRDRRRVDRNVSERTLIDNGDSNEQLIPGVVFSASGDRTFEDVSVTFSMGYDWRDNLHAYAKYVEAYRSGGYNVRDPDPVTFA